MACAVSRWSLGSLAFVALVAAFAPTLQGQGQITWIILLNSPQQLVEIPDDRDRVRLWRFQANARLADDGRAHGGAILERGSERYEFAFRSGSYAEDGDRVVLTLNGVGIATQGKQEQEFPFSATATQAAGNSGGIIIYDIQDGFVYHKPPFQAEGTIATP
jgi:hypothetical protein